MALQDQSSELCTQESLTILIPQTTPTLMDLKCQDFISVNMIPQQSESHFLQTGVNSLSLGSSTTEILRRPQDFEMIPQQNPSELERRQFPRRLHKLELSKEEMLKWQNTIRTFRTRQADKIIRTLSTNL